MCSDGYCWRQVSDAMLYASASIYLNSLSSSITCMPCSYCSLVGASPTFAKWLFPLIVMTDGAVGNLDAAAEGRLDGEDIVKEALSAVDRPDSIRRQMTFVLSLRKLAETTLESVARTGNPKSHDEQFTRD